MDYLLHTAALVLRQSTDDTGGGDATSEFLRECRLHPERDWCHTGYYGYKLDVAAYAAFIGIFGVSLIAYLVTYAVTRRGLAFTIAFLLGLICEVLGYAGRVMSWKNPWDENGFLMQICCLTIAPAFMAAGIYFCLRRIVFTFGPENSRIPPPYYTRIFIPCDVLSLILQAVGGAMASVASHNNKPVETGDNIMIAGLSFQVFTMLMFMLCSADFAFNAWRRHKKLGDAAFDQSASVAAIRNSWLFKGFLGALTLSTICIFWRCVFRVAELSKGWTGPLMKNQPMFIGFEGVMIVVAVVSLNVFHPSVCFKEMMEGEGGFSRKKNNAVQDSGLESGVGKSEQASDTEMGSRGATSS
ncbi:putative parasitic phase-specific protein psp-1 protein [Phaeoacremonium minimum UCRPA7]|uniref:Putative parasitic phase-specific protein psp-1 protein n=1 Tax=Phaeoacremonium minimum (strain UCR-PA7) TaxID=1286976 RepID=R8BJU8_PHAM7|nr:putative parasitic phase-specific protein psp-1 protein [Phaeoacremonium minimum UCRPA7]EON99628.1 putative parasitic phase-specific protein psp-1 protein [Phaeoacremonium minimum UCRPA7]